MTDELMDSLKQAFMKENDKSGGDCLMADKATSYAFGELSPEEAKNVKQHIQECRSCLDLVMDIKMAEEEAVGVKGEKVEVLPGLQRSIENKKKSITSKVDKVRESISEYIAKGKALFDIDITLYGRLQMGFRGGVPEYEKRRIKQNGIINSGDFFRFEVHIDRNAFVYLIFQNSSGEIESWEKGFVKGGQSLIIPEEGQWFQLDNNIGTEDLVLLASENEIEDFGKKVDRLKTDGIEVIKNIFSNAAVQSFSFQHR